jgi:hypothetical protein
MNFNSATIRHSVFEAMDNMVTNGYPVMSPFDQAIDLKTCDADLENVDLDVIIEYLNQWMMTSSK